MRRFIIDTDTASDDAVALIMALREPSIRVEAITVVAGNVPLDLAVKNAVISVKMAATYAPPVFKGMHKPMCRELFTSEFVHGSDGMGEMDLADPDQSAEEKHAVDALIELILAAPQEMEIVTLGPLTNLAMAYLREPGIAKNVKSVVVMGGAGLGSGNITPVAEYNMYVDAEAASIVLRSGMPITLVGWDASLGKSFIGEEDIRDLTSRKSPIADFCVRCNRSLQEFNRERFGKNGFDLPDPVAVAVAIQPDIVTDTFTAYADVETKGELTYGQIVIDRLGLLERKSNVHVTRVRMVVSLAPRPRSGLEISELRCHKLLWLVVSIWI